MNTNIRRPIRSGRVTSFVHTLLVFLFLTVLMTILFLATAATAQVGSAALSGVVEDQTGAAVPEASVTLENALNRGSRTIKSNGEGVFSFAAVPSGDYNLIIDRSGFARFVQNGIHLNPATASTFQAFAWLSVENRRR